MGVDYGRDYKLTFQPAQNVRVKVEITYTGTLTQEIFQRTIDHLRLDMDGFAKEEDVAPCKARESEDRDAI